MRACIPIFTFLSSLAINVSLTWAQEEPTTVPPPGTTNPFPELLTHYEEDLGSLQRFYVLQMNAVDQERMEQFHLDWKQRLQEIEFDPLSQAGRIDYLLFRNRLDYAIEQLGLRQSKDEEASDYLTFAPTIMVLADQRRRTDKIEPETTAGTLTKLAGAVQQAIKTLESTKDKRKDKDIIVLNRVRKRVKDLSGVLDEWHRFYNGYDPRFFWWNNKPYVQTKEALKAYADALQIAVGDEDTVVGDPIGGIALRSALDNEIIPYSPAELIAIGKREYQWCLTELKRAARDLGFEDDWQAALDHVKGEHVRPGNQPALIRELADEAVAFVENNDMLTLPDICKETWRMEMMSPERQRVNPYFTGGEIISVSFPTDDMAFEDKLMSLRGNNRHFARATVHHELIPGHHLQIYMAERHRPYRKQFRTPFLVEGWALYWEMLLWDMNFQQSAKDRIGMLFWRTHRCARIIFSLSFHMGSMTADEAVDYLVENVGHERRNATAEVRRSVQGAYDPLYQAAYMLGGLQMRALRIEAVDSGKMTEKEFHDAVLKENSIPLELIRASLLNIPLAPYFESTWRFDSYFKGNGAAAAKQTADAP